LTYLDGYAFGWNNSVFPALPGATLATLDPATSAILRFFRAVIQINLGAAYTADALACGMSQATMSYVQDGYMVAQAVSFPVDSTLTTTDYQFPLLSVYRNDRKFIQHSSMIPFIESQYFVNFVMPPMTVLQFNKLYKYLSAVSDVLVQRTYQTYDPQYNNGEQVFKTANIAYAEIVSDQYGSFLGADGKTEFPSIRMMLTVHEKSQFVASNYEAFDGADIQVNNADGYNQANPVLNVSDGYADPNLTINSLSVSSGPVAGGTMVMIYGAGFDNMKSSQTISNAVTFNGAPVSKLLVKSNELLIVITGPGAATGTGSVAVTDSLGNTFVLGNFWTYI